MTNEKQTKFEPRDPSDPYGPDKPIDEMTLPELLEHLRDCRGLDGECYHLREVSMRALQISQKLAESGMSLDPVPGGDYGVGYKLMNWIISTEARKHRAEGVGEIAKGLAMKEIVRILINQNPELKPPKCIELTQAKLKAEGRPPAAKQSIRTAFYNHKNTLKIKDI